MYTYRSELSNLENCPTKFDIGPTNLKNLSNIRSYFVLWSLHHYFRTMHVHHTNLYTHIRLLAPTKLMHNHISTRHLALLTPQPSIQGNPHTHTHTHAHTHTCTHTHTNTHTCTHPRMHTHTHAHTHTQTHTHLQSTTHATARSCRNFSTIHDWPQDLQDKHIMWQSCDTHECDSHVTDMSDSHVM